jgi:hypothetical protein
VGEKTTKIWQVPAGGNPGKSCGLARPRAAASLCAGLASSTALVAQLSLTIKKLFGFAPLSEMDVMPSDPVPGFESVKVCAELAVPVVTLPKSSVAGDSVACGTEVTAVPLPERATVNGDSGWLRSWTE